MAFINPEAVYIMASRPRGMLNTGRTKDLIRRTWEHRTGFIEGYTKRFSITKLVYFEWCEGWEAAWAREYQLKRWRRAWKFDLIETRNPGWKDLWFEIAGEEALPDAPPMSSSR